MIVDDENLHSALPGVRAARCGARREIYGATPRPKLANLADGEFRNERAPRSTPACSAWRARWRPRLRTSRHTHCALAAGASVEHALAARVETKEPDDPRALRRRYRMLAADQLVVRHAAIREDHRAPRARAHRRPERAPLAEHDCIEQVAFESDEALGGAVVVRAWQRRDEVDVSRRPPLDETPARDLDRDLDATGGECSAESVTTAPRERR